MHFKINEAGLDELQRHLDVKFSAGIQVPRDGSEDEAICSVKQQLESMGATPNEAEVQRLVRETRQA